MVDQADQVAAWERKRDRCPQCGGDSVECADAEHVWFPQRTVCFHTMQRAAALARYEDLHRERPFHDGSFRSWSKERTESSPFHYMDGVNVWLSAHDLSPDDDFLAQGSGLVAEGSEFGREQN